MHEVARLAAPGVRMSLVGVPGDVTLVMPGDKHARVLGCSRSALTLYCLAVFHYHFDRPTADHIGSSMEGTAEHVFQEAGGGQLPHPLKAPAARFVDR